MTAWPRSLSLLPVPAGGVRTELVNWLLTNGHQVFLVISDPARLVLKQELDWEIKAVRMLPDILRPEI